jgi:hypothetical protein
LLDEAAPHSHRKTQPVSWLRKIALGNSPLSIGFRGIFVLYVIK